jgi:hypothetical protein
MGYTSFLLFLFGFKKPSGEETGSGSGQGQRNQ